MKKKLLAFACAAVLTFGMSMTAFAATSPTAGSTASAEESGSTVEPATRTVGSKVLSTEMMSGYASSTTLSTSVPGASITPVGINAAASMQIFAERAVGSNAVIATMVDINVPAGTGTATFTLGVPSLVAGQSVTVIHLKDKDNYEVLPVSAVGNGTVTFTMSSYSPVAVVLNATSPKTGEAGMAVVLMTAMAGIAGAAVCGRKFARG